MSNERDQSQYLFERYKDVNPRSAARVPLNIYSKKYKWAVFKLQPVLGLVSHHGYAEIEGETEHLFKLKEMVAPAWKKYWYNGKQQRRIKKDAVTEFYSTEEEARLATNLINKIVEQENNYIKELVHNIHNTYFEIIDTALLVK